MSQIKRIEIKNIKAIEKFEINFDKKKKLILLIGHNNSGKTSIIKAVKLFFSDETNADEFWPLDIDGSYRELSDNPYVLVEIRFSAEEIENIRTKLSESKHKQALESYLIEDSLIIRKPLQKDRKDKITAKILECKFKDKDDFDNFTGIKQDLSRLLPRFIYLESVANLEDYQSASQRAQHSFEELFDLYFEGLQWENEEDIKSLVTKLIDKINEKIGILDIKDKLQKTLQELDNELETHELTHGFTSVSDLANLIKKVKITIKDNVICDASLKGSGTQRLVIFSLLKLIAQQRSDTKRDTIFLIDEPDLHLHPQLQKQIRAIIQKLAENYPIIVSTHSHLMIGKGLSDDYIIKKIYKLKGVVKDEAIDNKEKFFRELFIYLGYVPSDFLLPDNIVLVSGKFDKLFLDKVIEILRNNNIVDIEHDVSVINVGGDGQINKAFKFIKDLESAVAFFQGLPAYKDRFCAILDAKKENSLTKLRSDANDNQKSHRIIVLNDEKDKSGKILDGIEFYYPKSLTKQYCENENLSLEDIVKDNDLKNKLSSFVLDNLEVKHLDEIKDITDLAKLSFEKAKIL